MHDGKEREMMHKSSVSASVTGIQTLHVRETKMRITTLLLCGSGLLLSALAMAPLHAQTCASAAATGRISVTVKNKKVDVPNFDQTTWGSPVHLVWYAPPGWEFHDQGVVIPNDPNHQFSEAHTGDETISPTNPPTTSNAYHWCDQNNDQQCFKYTITLFDKSTGKSASKDPFILNEGSRRPPCLK
jgi:hypothetical protein